MTDANESVQRLLKFVATLACGIVAGCCSHRAPEAVPPVPVTVDELRQHPPIGDLGLPLGTAIEIEATIISGSATLRKADDGRYLLRLSKIGTRQLAEPTIMRFSVPGFVRAGVALNWQQLYTLRTGKEESGGLSSNQMGKLEVGYVGKHVRLLVFEAGEFSGIPTNFPPMAVTWQDHGFWLETMLIVLKDFSVEGESGSNVDPSLGAESKVEKQSSSTRAEPQQ